MAAITSGSRPRPDTTGNTFGQLAYNSGSNTFATTPTTFAGNPTTQAQASPRLTVDVNKRNVWGPSQERALPITSSAPYTSTVPDSTTTGDLPTMLLPSTESGNIWITGTVAGVNSSHLFMVAHGIPPGAPIVFLPTITAGSGTVCGRLKGSACTVACADRRQQSPVHLELRRRHDR